MRTLVRNYLWITLGWLSITLGVIGIFLPLLPTTPFLLLAAFAFSRGSEKLHNWLLNHPRLGPPIQAWQASGVIARRPKVYATLGMVAGFLLAWFMQAPMWALALQAIVLVCVGLFLWSRPEH